jgi:hypothetical protein
VRKYFYIGLAVLLIFEVLNVYFIMPMPGSQQMNSVALAYFLYRWRWVVRIICGATMIYGLVKGKWRRPWTLLIPFSLVAAAIYFMNFRMSADQMFHQPEQLIFSGSAQNQVDTERLVLGVVINDEAKAYPISFIGYHHIVQDTVGGKPVLLSYCTVCRSGRAYDPVVDGKVERFRLVGMDHFNAMFEDVTTKSWWRQAIGEAVAGKQKGKKLQEIFCTQATLGEWMRMYPQTLIMQEDPTLKEYYPRSFDYENGLSKSKLTGTDTVSWKAKSWVVGVEYKGAKAYDWNLLKSKRIIEDRFKDHTVILVLAKNNKSFFAYTIPAGHTPVVLKDGRLAFNDHEYTLHGKGIDTNHVLEKVPAYQEFWHSWRMFHPATQVYRY